MRHPLDNIKIVGRDKVIKYEPVLDQWPNNRTPKQINIYL